MTSESPFEPVAPPPAPEGGENKAKNAARNALASARAAATRLADAAKSSKAGDEANANVERKSALSAAAGASVGATKGAAPRRPSGIHPEAGPTTKPARTGALPQSAAGYQPGIGGYAPQMAFGGPQQQTAFGPRRVRLAVSRVDPWSVMKLGFLLAVAIGIMTVVATIVFWFVIDRLGLFATVQQFINDVIGQQTDVDLTQFFAFDRVVSLATLVAVINVVLITAITTIIAIIYNLTAALVGGVHLTLTDD